MWIMLNTGFLSVVAATAEGMKQAGVDGEPQDWLSVRARKADHITSTFPDVAVMTTPGRDYAARAYVPRSAVARVMVEQVRRIDYPNFKDSVKDRALHDAYLQVWNDMWDYQHGNQPEAEGALSL